MQNNTTNEYRYESLHVTSKRRQYIIYS